MNLEISKQKAIFLDRDGTLIEEVNYLHRVEDLRFFDFTDEAVKLLKNKGFLVIITTNQSGIGRKIYTEADMNTVHEAIQNSLTEKIDGFYFCPHAPDEGCYCRKPNLGMIEQAQANFEIDLENSWMVGDKALDVEFGHNAKLKTALVLTGYGQSHLSELKQQPDFVAENLLEAVNHIIKNQ